MDKNHQNRATAIETHEIVIPNGASLDAQLRDLLKKLLALLALASVTACSGGGGNSGSAGFIPTGTANSVLGPPSGTGVLARIVGVGDSLTAGTQADGTMGASYTGNPASALPGGTIPATQTNGFFALLYEQATGTTVAAMANSSTSVLPLIATPGNGSELVVSAPPNPFAPSQLACSSFNQSMFSLAGLSSYRLNPNTIPLDIGVPGITMHEALTMQTPLTGPPPSAVAGSCPSYPTIPGDPTSGAFQALVNSESSMFYPVLGSFSGKLGSGIQLTEVNAAVGLRPTLTTVWLGANDLLKYIGSHGLSPSDTPAKLKSDEVSIINQLKAIGSKVVVANLPDVLGLPQYFAGGATLTATLTAFLEQAGFPAGASATAAANASANIQSHYGVSGAGYLTESGFFATFSQVSAGILASNLNVTPVLDPSVAGSGDGANYLDDAFAAQAQALNTAYNTSIAAAATATGATLVDIHAVFAGIKSGTGPYAAAAGVNPPKCCGLAFGGGLLSWDGLHPSNTGYALIANVFIQTINSAFSTSIPAVNATAVYNGTTPYGPLPDPYAMH